MCVFQSFSFHSALLVFYEVFFSFSERSAVLFFFLFFFFFFFFERERAFSDFCFSLALSVPTLTRPPRTLIFSSHSSLVDCLHLFCFECLCDTEVVDKPDPPEFLTRPKLVTVLEGEAATFTCHVKGHPLPAVWWERNGCKLSTDENYKVSGNTFVMASVCGWLIGEVGEVVGQLSG